MIKKLICLILGHNYIKNDEDVTGLFIEEIDRTKFGFCKRCQQYKEL